MDRNPMGTISGLAFLQERELAVHASDPPMLPVCQRASPDLDPVCTWFGSRSGMPGDLAKMWIHACGFVQDEPVMNPIGSSQKLIFFFFLISCNRYCYRWWGNSSCKLCCDRDLLLTAHARSSAVVVWPSSAIVANPCLWCLSFPHPLNNLCFG